MTARRGRAAPHGRVAAIVPATVALTGAVLTTVGSLLYLVHGRPGDFLFSLVFILLVADLALVGGVLAVRRPDNRIGWLLLLAAVLAAVGTLGGEYARLDDLLGRGGLPLVSLAAWTGTWAFGLEIGILVVFLPLLYPSGRLPSSRWRSVVGLALPAMTMSTLSNALTPGPLSGTEWLVNPFAVGAPWSAWLHALGGASNLLGAPIFLLVNANLILRFRRSRGVERQQLKWFLFVASVAAVSMAAGMVNLGVVSDVLWLCGLLAMGALPLAIGISILRYRLYDIDRIVSRAVSYSLVTATLAGLFALIILVSQVILSPLTGANSLAVAVSTLVVATAFRPVRGSVQRLVDRRFDRARVDADRVVTVFAERMRDEVDLGNITSEMSDTVQQTLRPRLMGVWLRGGRPE